MLTEFKRVKHGQQPGDVAKRHKIRMREKQTPFRIWYSSEYGQLMSNACGKAFRKFLQEKSRKRQRRRDAEEIERQLNL